MTYRLPFHPIPSLAFAGALCLIVSGLALSQGGKLSSLPVRYEELTAPEFVTAAARSGGICIVPIGILEKHGPHLPLGTDLINVREMVLRAAAKEYCVVYPPYYCGQIFEARHQPGTIAYSTDLMWKLLQETCDEMARNGFGKIVLANGHGGNNSFLPFFCQAQLSSRKGYSVVLFAPSQDPAVAKRVKELRKTTGGGHADEEETSMMLAHRPELVHMERAKEQSGADLDRLSSLPFAYTGIWWYARYPNHYAGDGSEASRELGDLLLNSESDQLAALVKALKSDKTLEELQNRFYGGAEKPLQTGQ